MDNTAIQSDGTAARPVAPTAIQTKAPYPAVHANGAPAPLVSLAPGSVLRQVLEPIASLRLTVALFALSLVLVFYGTWAQVDEGIWYVVSKYFRSLWVWIPLDVILFHSIDESPFLIPFPGGWLLGGLLLTNLLAAHALRFKMTWQRSGIFVLHAGLIVMMLGEFFTGLTATEGIMSIVEGQSSNYVENYHKAELAVVNIADPKWDDTVAIPNEVLRRGLVSHPNLPFDIELVKYMLNSVSEDPDPAQKSLATAGFGLDAAVTEIPVFSGADPNQKFDHPAAYITLKDKQTGKAIDTYLVRFDWKPQKLSVDGQTYEIALRPTRSYRDFSVHLDKATFKVHPRTKKAKDYSSYVRIMDEGGKEVRSARIFMNHPLYFNGETYFQSSMAVDARPLVTGLQVVYNWAWPMPYISCVMVAMGMLLHFGMNLWTFLQRRIMT
ncbi:MAG: cytochrome c biogenesis protein ResB [Gemmataceae bacterium]|nr:cytochrome c biogenesis protein ResB [Gemmataceae bacterium]